MLLIFTHVRIRIRGKVEANWKLCILDPIIKNINHIVIFPLNSTYIHITFFCQNQKRSTSTVRNNEFEATKKMLSRFDPRDLTPFEDWRKRNDNLRQQVYSTKSKAKSIKSNASLSPDAKFWLQLDEENKLMTKIMEDVRSDLKNAAIDSPSAISTSSESQF